MFFIHRPSRDVVDRFIDDSKTLPLSYSPVGIANGCGAGRGIDDMTAAIGRGREGFARARAALVAWKQFDIGWVELFPHGASLDVGTCVAVLIRHFGFWSLNGCRVVYGVGAEADARFGVAYGTLTNHAEAGEELFEVFLDPRTGDVMYHIRAISWPQAMLTRVGLPIARLLQARFRADSAAAMQRAARGSGR
jgi:uncharacterized protein (UPF0548 family)